VRLEVVGDGIGQHLTLDDALGRTGPGSRVLNVDKEVSVVHAGGDEVLLALLVEVGLFAELDRAWHVHGWGRLGWGVECNNVQKSRRISETASSSKNRRWDETSSRKAQDGGWRG
jgi:hypothetical protein